MRVFRCGIKTALRLVLQIPARRNSAQNRRADRFDHPIRAVRPGPRLNARCNGKDSMITIRSSTGEEFAAYLALPNGPPGPPGPSGLSRGEGPGLVLLQEIFGVNRD